MSEDVKRKTVQVEDAAGTLNDDAEAVMVAGTGTGMLASALRTVFKNLFECVGLSV